MGTRKTPFENGEFYHVYNRGVEKRNIFSDEDDIQRFLQSMMEFNEVNPIGSLYENSFRLGGPTPKFDESEEEKLVNFICYCLNPNHYHFILEQVTDGGISEFMKRLSGGYTGYFNNKNKRTGVLFQGKFKSIHISSNEYLLHLSAYVNLNDHVHKLQLGGPTPKLVKSRSSWVEYVGEKNTREMKTEKIQNIKMKKDFCNKDIILEQFRNKKEYREFAESSLSDILERRADMADMKDIGKLLLE